MKLMICFLIMASFTANAQSRHWNKKFCNSLMIQTLHSSAYWVKRGADRAREAGKSQLAIDIDTWANSVDYDQTVCESFNKVSSFTNKLESEISALRWQAKQQKVRRTAWSLDTASEILMDSERILCRESGFCN